MKIHTLLRALDYIPIASSASNTYIVFKKIIIDIRPQNGEAASPSYTYLSEKSYIRCIILILAPFAGNIFFAIYDLIPSKSAIEPAARASKKVLIDPPIRKEPKRMQKAEPVEEPKAADISTFKNADEALALIQQNPARLKNIHSCLKNERFYLKALQQIPSTVDYLPFEYSHSDEFAAKALAENPSLYTHFPNSLNKHRALKFVEKNPSLFHHLPSELRYNQEFLIDAISQNLELLDKIPPQFLTDESFMLGLIAKKPEAFKKLSIDRQREKEFCRQSVLANPFVIEWIDDDKIKKALILTALKRDGTVMRVLPDHYKKSRLHAKYALEQTAEAFELIDPSFYANKELMLIAVSKKPSLLQKIAPSLRDDLDIVGAAVEQDGLTLKWAGEKARQNVEIVELALNQNALAFEFADESIKANLKWLAFALQKDVRAVSGLSPEQKFDPEIIAYVLKEHPNALPYFFKKELIAKENSLRPSSRDPNFLNESDKDNPAVALPIILKDCNNLRHFGAAVKDDLMCVLASVKGNGNNLQYASDRLKNHPAVVYAALSECWWAFEYASEELRSNLDFAWIALHKDTRTLLYTARAVRENENFMELAIEKDVLAFFYLHDSIAAAPRMLAYRNDPIFKEKFEKRYRQACKGEVTSGGYQRMYQLAKPKD